MQFLGKQYFIELYDCKKEKLDDPDFIAKHMNVAAVRANATVVQQFFHQFSPYGVSGTVVIEESHLNIHTWPEYNYAAVDIFTCGETLNAKNAVKYLAEVLEAQKVQLKEIDRGSLEEIHRNKKITH